MDQISKKIKMIKKNLNSLKKLFLSNKIDGYIVPKNDAYFSEYSNPDRLKIISNFSGSAGYAIILRTKNFLFVDGRYTLQAKIESGKNFEICEIPYKLPKNIFSKKTKKKIVLGFDPQLFTNFTIQKLFSNHVHLKPIEINLIDKIHKIKKRRLINKFYNLNTKITGENIKSKISRLLIKLKKSNIENIFISAPENVAWLLNLRGRDNPNSPIPNSKLILTKKREMFFFSCPKKILKIRNNINYKNLQFHTYKDFENIIKNLGGKNFCIDKTTCSISNEKIIRSKFRIKLDLDPCYLFKSIKNKVEIKNMRDAHLKDGVALTKFIYWIKKINKNKITELDAQKKLETFRKQNKDYLFPSFNTIAGTGSNGAIVHYKATKKTNKQIDKKHLFLCDSGGQYKYGTTDVTRTICFSNQKLIIKNNYTDVLKGHIAVAQTNLRKFNKGKKIDYRARKFLKKRDLDYNHGTGHGVGFFLNVHEGPQSISKFNSIELKEGMVLSNEPGYYKKDHYGIRIENLVYIKKKLNNLIFENLTLAPLEKDLINFNLLTKNEKDYLFKYHLLVYLKLKKYLDPNERKWLASFLVI